MGSGDMIFLRTALSDGPEISFQPGKESLAIFCFIGDFGFPQKRNGETALFAICRN